MCGNKCVFVVGVAALYHQQRAAFAKFLHSAQDDVPAPFVLFVGQTHRSAPYVGLFNIQSCKSFNQKNHSSEMCGKICENLRYHWAIFVVGVVALKHQQLQHFK
ncbi:MAG: hypothetical protein ACOYOA_16280 [Saprospiraceae bacterium]